MLLAGSSIFLNIFSLETWTLKGTIPLEIDACAVRQIDFIPQDTDGGNNNILAVLAEDGVLYIYNLSKNEIINVLQLNSEIISFEVTKSGDRFSCILNSGEVNVYKSSNLVSQKKVLIDKEEAKVQKKLKLYLPPKKEVS